MSWLPLNKLFLRGREKSTQKGKTIPPITPEAPSHPYYSRYYNKLKEIGHLGSTPEFSAPALVWHLALWPLRRHDPQHVFSSDTDWVSSSNDSSTEKRDRSAGSSGDRIRISARVKERLDALMEEEFDAKQKHDSDDDLSDLPGATDEFYENAVSQYRENTSEQDAIINELLRKLQELGRAKRDGERWDKFTRSIGVSESDRTVYNAYFATLDQPEIGFTIWWSDNGPIRGEKPGPDAIRVRVEVVRRMDFAVITFFIDATGVWKGGAGTEAGGARRGEILRRMASVEEICGPRLGRADIEEDLLPEKLRDPEDAERLLEASRYLYDRLWVEFCADFELGSKGNPEDLAAITGNNKVSRVFANFRGLVMAAEGLPAGDSGTPEVRDAHAGMAAFGRFSSGEGEKKQKPEKNEANAVVKAYWPFIRRITAKMDYRDVIACGVMNWRCLVVTSLGSAIKDDPKDEGLDISAVIPDNHLRIDVPNYDEKAPEPVRHLFITKGQPNPKQIGRIVERVCTLETIRLYALKDWDVLQNASIHIRMRGQELDQIIHEWTMGRSYIDLQHRVKRAENRQRTKVSEIDDKRDEWITKYTRYIESRLLNISATLDRIGQSSVGGVHFRIGRSRYYAQEFHDLLKTLKVGNIETWVSYETFALRGLNPALTFVNELGSRLNALRSRVLAVTDGIEASALVAQTSATRQNTAQLRKIARNARYVSLFGILSALGVFGYYISQLTKQIIIVSSGQSSPADLWSTVVWALISALATAIFVILGRRD
jgi:hypothetical protein